MKTLLMAAFLLSTMIACGKNANQRNPQPTVDEQFYSQFTSGACGLDVVSDYNSVVFKVMGMVSNQDISDAQKLARQFNAKYPEINCSVETGYGLDKKTTMLTKHSFDELLSI